MSKKKLVLHVGTHKTGTTTIQNTLAGARDALLAQGICYARTDRKPFPKLNKHCSTYQAVLGSQADFDAEFALLEAEMTAAGCDTLLLSEEGFSEARYDEFSKFESLLDRFDLTVIGLFRRQDLFLESVWNQYCREGHERQAIHNFVHRPMIAGRTRYADILAFWAGLGQVIAMSFDQARAGGIVSRFGQHLGLELADPARRENVSPSMNCAAAMALLNRFDHEYDNRVLVRAFAEDQSRYALGSQLRGEILDGLAEQNAILKDKYGIEFDMQMPEEPEQSLKLPRPAALAGALSYLIDRAGVAGPPRAQV